MIFIDYFLRDTKLHALIYNFVLQQYTIYPVLIFFYFFLNKISE